MFARADRFPHSDRVTEQTKSAVVTGAASGMGESVTQRFVAEGWRVLAVDLDASSLESLVAQHGSAIVPVAVDVRDRAAVDDAIGSAVGDSALMAVVNAAGIYPTSTLDDYTEDVYRRIFDINVLGTINVTAAAVPHVRAHGGGPVGVVRLGVRITVFLKECRCSSGVA